VLVSWWGKKSTETANPTLSPDLSKKDAELKGKNTKNKKSLPFLELAELSSQAGGQASGDRKGGEGRKGGVLKKNFSAYRTKKEKKGTGIAETDARRRQDLFAPRETNKRGDP